MSYYSYCMSCVLTFKRDVCSIFLHNFIKGAERERERKRMKNFLITVLRWLALIKGDILHLLLIGLLVIVVRFDLSI